MKEWSAESDERCIGTMKNILYVIKTCLKYAKVSVIINFFLNIVGGLLTPIMVYVVANFINSAISLVSGTKDTRMLFVSVSIILFSYMFYQLSEICINYFNKKLENELATKFKPLLVETLATVDYEIMEDSKSLDLIEIILNNMEANFTQVISDFYRAIRMIIQVVGIMYILYTQAWWLNVILIFITIPLIALSHRGGTNVYEADKKTTMLTRVMNYLSGVLTSRETSLERELFGFSKGINERFKAAHLLRSNINTKVIFREMIYIKVCALVMNLFIVVCVIVLIPNVQNSILTGGLYISIVGAMLSLVSVLSNTLSALVYNYSKYKEYLSDYFKFTSQKGDRSLLTHKQEIVDFEVIEMKNLFFKYKNSEKYILNGVNLTIQKGKSYSLIGINGAGKTTLIKIIMGLYTDYEGEILLDGKNIKDYSTSYKRNLFSIVYQDFAKYYVSIKDNITFDNPTDISKITHMVELDEIISKHGEDCNLGKIFENGVDISGGEWQKVAIARALYKNLPLLILDEPTASLSPNMESKMYSKLPKISNTLLLISHRLGSTKISDVILVLDKGKIIEQGSHEELMIDNGFYAKIFESQKGWYGE